MFEESYLCARPFRILAHSNQVRPFTNKQESSAWCEIVSGEETGPGSPLLSIAADLSGVKEGAFLSVDGIFIKQNLNWDKLSSFTLLGSHQREKSGLM